VDDGAGAVVAEFPDESYMGVDFGAVVSGRPERPFVERLEQGISKAVAGGIFGDEATVGDIAVSGEGEFQHDRAGEVVGVNRLAGIDGYFYDGGFIGAG